jgi:hypothetical protein
LKMSTTKIQSTCRIANIGPDDAMILAHAANPDGSNFRKGQVPQPQQPPRRPPDIVLPVGQPLPKPPGIEWWLKKIAGRK